MYEFFKNEPVRALLAACSVLLVFTNVVFLAIAENIRMDSALKQEDVPPWVDLVIDL